MECPFSVSKNPGLALHFFQVFPSIDSTFHVIESQCTAHNGSRNLDPSPRLDRFENDRVEIMRQEAGQEFRVLRFPRATESQSETAEHPFLRARKAEKRRLA